ncbi:PRC-barrel domain containing protein [Oceanobacillus picturae]|uniref:PRC-barrel domain containing protein n=1 Tax=Oceanobacillus picturae TaxID=171693 RepID=UPI003636D3D0
MLFFTSELKTYNIHAADGVMGKVKDLYFDDEKWAIRYAIVDTRKWLPGRRVLLSPSSFITLNENDKHLEVEYDKEKVRNSPSISEESAVSKDVEDSLIGYYGWNRYWTGNMLWGSNDRPLAQFPPVVEPQPEVFDQQLEAQSQYNLRSEDETIEFKVHADDGKIGTVADMVFDSEYWKLRYLVVQDSETYTKEQYFVYHTDQIESVDWFERDIYIKGSLAETKNDTKYNSKDMILTSLSRSNCP